MRYSYHPKLTDVEVITIEICGEFFKLHEETEIYNLMLRTTDWSASILACLSARCGAKKPL